MTGSKVSQRFLVKEASGKAVGFGGGKLLLMVQIFSVNPRKNLLEFTEKAVLDVSQEYFAFKS